MHKHAYLTIWLFFFGLESLFLALIYWSGYNLTWLMQADQTGFSVFILFVFLIGWLFAFRNIWWLEKLYNSEYLEIIDWSVDYEARSSILSYIIFTLPALGFLGTVVGVYIITENFDQALKSVTEIAKLIEHVRNVIGGMKTAVITTIIGLTASSFLALLHAVFYIGYIQRGRYENTA